MNAALALIDVLLAELDLEDARDKLAAANAKFQLALLIGK